MGRNRNKGCGSRPRPVSSQNPEPNPTKRPNSFSAGGFVDGGVLTDWQHIPSGGKPRRKSKGFKPRGNAFAFTYPTNADADDAPRIAVVEPRASVEIPVDGPRSELGFRGRDDDVDEKEDDREGEFGEESVGFDPRLNLEKKHKKMNEGFLSIGGLRLYTEDVSSPDEASDDLMDEDEDEEDEDEDEEDSGGESTEVEDGEEDGGSLEDDGLSSSIDSDDSDIDDEVVEDYLEGIGGKAALLGSEWLAGRSLEEYDEDGLLKSSNSGDEGDGKMSGFALMHASMEYGMKKKANARIRKGSAKKNVDVSPVVDVELSALDDVLLMKDARRRARHKKLVSSQVSRSWPADAQMSKKYKNVMGGKKKHRKELIAVKRRERMINRGVDLDEINLKLRQMVLDELDTLSFVPMHSHDCTQVQRLASIYRLHSGCQGSGKKRFVIVTRTAHTSLPSTTDRVRLDKLLGAGIEDEDFAVNEVKSKPQRLSKGKMKMSGKSPSSASRLRTGLQLSAPSKLSKHEASGNKKQASKKSSFSERPVSFVSCGVMQTDQVSEPVATIPNEMVVHSCPPKMGAFEVHTKGFGSKMMAKMGFVEGGGLGKDGQGMLQPIQPTKRPKSLGLGVEYAEKTTGVEYTEKANDVREKTTDVRAQQVEFGSFEKHTQGFGSKMMVKMGFVPGTGLGKDGQGITTPLSAVRFPKSRGLGAKS